MKRVQNEFFGLKKKTSDMKKLIEEISRLDVAVGKSKDVKEIQMLKTNIRRLKISLGNRNREAFEDLKKINLVQPLYKPQVKQEEVGENAQEVQIYEPQQVQKVQELMKKPGLTRLEKETLKRIQKSDKDKENKIENRKNKKPSAYVAMANKYFARVSSGMIDKGWFRHLNRDLMQANIPLIPKSYISVILFTTTISIAVGFFAFVFFMFVNVSSSLPVISFVSQDFGLRFLRTFWLIFVIPIGTFLMVYFYPAMEKSSIATRIDYELPFATIHMSSISGSMIDPSKIFKIIISTHEYPNLEKEFTKLINEVNVFGYDLVTALRRSAFNSPSRKLTDLLNGMATTINSGGDLNDFFDKRAESLLFEYRIEREKYTRSAETFMDIYISVVIAAPMILMLLLMMMKISGLGVQISTFMITFIMVAGVTLVNIGFLVFLHLKQPAG